MMDTNPSTFYHSPAVREFNANARRNNLEGLSAYDLSEPALIAAAQKETGLMRFGEESFLPVMRLLLAAIESEAKLNPFGRFIAKSRTMRALKNRLWTNAMFEAHPEILRHKIVAPIVIVGPHRSGTTRLQHLLATDSQLQHLTAWEGLNPTPRPGQSDLGKTDRYEEASKMLDGKDRIYPGSFDAHPMKADWAEEEMLLMTQSFCGFAPLAQYRVPSYYRWFVEGDKTFGYQELADLLRLISWSRGNPDNKRWILKNPQHMLDLDLLLKVFPDARLVFTHRDPIKTVGSVMSLMWYYAVQHTDAGCREGIRDVWMDFCERSARNCMEVRESIPASQQLDVYYDETNRDWGAVMRRIYDFAGIDFTPAIEQRMSAFQDKSAAEKRHGGHRYSLEDFGTSDAEVDARMMFVRKRYDIPYESR